MDRQDIFNAAAAQAPAVDLPQAADEIDRALGAAEDAFTFNPDDVALPEMLKAFQSVIAAGIAGMRDGGAYSRDTGQLLGFDEGDVCRALGEERAYQDSKVTPGYTAAIRDKTVSPRTADPHYSLTEEVNMMRAYFRREVRAPLDAGDQEKAANGIRKVAAMALRGSENPSL